MEGERALYLTQAAANEIAALLSISLEGLDAEMTRHIESGARLRRRLMETATAEPSASPRTQQAAFSKIASELVGLRKELKAAEKIAGEMESQAEAAASFAGVVAKAFPLPPFS